MKKSMLLWLAVAFVVVMVARCMKDAEVNRCLESGLTYEQCTYREVFRWSEVLD